jgi:transglutaminase-like putative cysteine protease
MASRRSRVLGITTIVLVALPLAIMTYKVTGLGYSLADVLPRTRHHVAVDMKLDGHDGDVRVRTFLPVSDDRQVIGDEQNQAPALRFKSDAEGINRVGVWSGVGVPDGAHVRFEYTVLSSPVRYDIDPEVALPSMYPSSVASYLRPEEDVQVDSPEIRAALREIGADHGNVRARLDRIFAFTSGLPQRPFKGTTDALTALRLREASCNGKSRLFVALARAAGLPARLVGGLILETGHKRTSHQWLEVYVAGHWVPFCPTNHHFAGLPASYLTLYRGDEALFKHTSDVNFGYGFDITAEMVPSPRAKEAFKVFNVWSLFERLRLPFSLLRTILMLPIGALVVVVFRNVIGMPTFGTFLPALIAAAAGETGAGWGVVAILLLVAVVAVVRWAVARLELLHSPTLAILLAAVALTILATSLLAEQVGLVRLTRITMFPLAVMAITAERFYLGLAEHGPRAAGKELAGTLLVMLACYVVMNSLALQVLVIGFPEILLLVVAADVYLGRWVGVRLSEYLRFRGLFRAAEAA